MTKMIVLWLLVVTSAAQVYKESETVSEQLIPFNENAYLKELSKNLTKNDANQQTFDLIPDGPVTTKCLEVTTNPDLTENQNQDPNNMAENLTDSRNIYCFESQGQSSPTSEDFPSLRRNSSAVCFIGDVSVTTKFEYKGKEVWDCRTLSKKLEKNWTVKAYYTSNITKSLKAALKADKDLQRMIEMMKQEYHSSFDQKFSTYYERKIKCIPEILSPWKTNKIMKEIIFVPKTNTGKHVIFCKQIKKQRRNKTISKSVLEKLNFIKTIKNALNNEKNEGLQNDRKLKNDSDLLNEFLKMAKAQQNMKQAHEKIQKKDSMNMKDSNRKNSIKHCITAFAKHLPENIKKNMSVFQNKMIKSMMLGMYKNDQEWFSKMARTIEVEKEKNQKFFLLLLKNSIGEKNVELPNITEFRKSKPSNTMNNSSVSPNKVKKHMNLLNIAGSGYKLISEMALILKRELEKEYELFLKNEIASNSVDRPSIIGSRNKKSENSKDNSSMLPMKREMSMNLLRETKMFQRQIEKNNKQFLKIVKDSDLEKKVKIPSITEFQKSKPGNSENNTSVLSNEIQKNVNLLRMSKNNQERISKRTRMVNLEQEQNKNLFLALLKESIREINAKLSCIPEYQKSKPGDSKSNTSVFCKKIRYLMSLLRITKNRHERHDEDNQQLLTILKDAIREKNPKLAIVTESRKDLTENTNSNSHVLREQIPKYRETALLSQREAFSKPPTKNFNFDNEKHPLWCPHVITNRIWKPFNNDLEEYGKVPISFVSVINEYNFGNCWDQKSCLDIMKKMRNHHIKSGSMDILHNFCIGGDGYVYEGIGWNYYSTVPKLDFPGISLCLMSDFTKENFSNELAEVARSFLECSSNIGRLSANFKVIGHLLKTPARSQIYAHGVVRRWDRFDSNLIPKYLTYYQQQYNVSHANRHKVYKNAQNFKMMKNERKRNKRHTYKNKPKDESVKNYTKFYYITNKPKKAEPI